MKQIAASFFTTVALLFSFYIASAQTGVMPTYPNHKLGPYSGKNRFIEIPTDSRKSEMPGTFFFEGTDFHILSRFRPKRNNIKAYKENGQVHVITKAALLEIWHLYDGSYDGKTGKWVQADAAGTTNSFYVFLNDLDNVEDHEKSEDELRSAEIIAAQKKEAKEAKDKSWPASIFLASYLFLVCLLIPLFAANVKKLALAFNGKDWPQTLLFFFFMGLGIWGAVNIPLSFWEIFIVMIGAPIAIAVLLKKMFWSTWQRTIKERDLEDQKEDIKDAYGAKGWAEYWDLDYRLNGTKGVDTFGIHIGEGRHWNEHGHMLTVGGSGGGKGVSLILPALLSDGLVNAGISVVCLDPKGENAAVSVPHLRRAGYDVHVINPFQIPQIRNLGNSRFNPFDLIEPHEAKRMCDVLAFSLHNRQNSGSSSFFDNKCRNYISLYMRYALHTGNGNFDYVYQKLQLPGKKREEFLLLMSGGDDTFSGAQEAENIYTALTSLSAKTEEDIFGTIQEAINILGDDALRGSLSASDFDLRTIAQKPTAIFICIKHDELRYYAPWVRMFTDFLLKTLTTYYNPKRKVLVLLDEFAQLGYVNEFKNSPAVLRGYNVTLWPIVQYLGQLKSLYGDDWETFISSAAVKHWLPDGMDNTSADYLEKRMPMDIKFVGTNADGSPREVQSKLMDASQIMRESDFMICELNKLPNLIRFKKIWYKDLPFAGKNASPNPFY